MTIYDRLTSASTRMLAPVASGGKGALVTITTLGTPGEYDEATDTQTPGTPTTQTGSGVEDAVSAYSVVNGLAQAGDVKFLLSPMTSDAYGRSTGTPLTAPVPDRDTLTKGGQVWAIKKVDPVQPAGTPIMYTLVLRQGA